VRFCNKEGRTTLVATTASVIAWGPHEKPKPKRRRKEGIPQKKEAKPNIARHLNSCFTATEKNAVCFL